MQDEKVKIILLMVVTWLADLVWLLYWGPFWNSDDMKGWQEGIHFFVLTTSTIGFLLKVSLDASHIRLP